ncbi:MAG: family 16 glycoside hydrolase [Phycisphaerae bacterium]
MIRFAAVVLLALGILVGRLGAMDCPFFAMDTGLRDGKHNTPEARAATLAELGYAGSDLSGTGRIPETLKAYDAKGLKLFAIYVGANIDSDKVSPALAAAIKQLKGRGTILWMPLNSRKFKPSDPAGDEKAVALLSKIADLAAESGLKIAMYPHTGSWVERVEDAARVAKKVDRPNVGATLNLCHWLQVDGKDLAKSLRYAMPHLFVVTINGADKDAKGWGRLIQTLDKGTYDVGKVLALLKEMKYTGPIGLQAYAIKGDSKENLRHSMAAWKKLTGQAAAAASGKRVELLAGGGLSAFRPDTGDWMIAGDVFTDPNDEKRLAWKQGVGALVNGAKGRTRNLFTKHEHGDCEAHVEFMVPKGSNSGVYFQGRYEIQILDSWGVEKPEHGDCGGIYQRWANGKGFEGRPPRVNASGKPGEWQTFDVVFRAPRFGADGTKIANACFVKVVHNGIVVHENEEVTGPTRAAAFGDEKPAGPIMLQGDHGPVAYRNIWIIERDLTSKTK